MWTRFLRWAADSEGSSRSAALIRIGLALLIWSRWARETAPFYNPSVLRVALGVALYGSTALMFAGLWTRWAVPSATAIVTTMYAYAVYADSSWHANHVYLLIMAMWYCTLTPCGRSYSVDRWLEVRRCRRLGLAPPPERGNLIGLRLMALQVAVLYFFAAFDKTHWGYLNGSRVESILMTYYSGSVFPDWPGFHAACVALGLSTLALEYSLAFGLFFAKSRRILIPLGILFHVGLYFTLPVLTFSMTMILLYLAFLDPDAVHRVIDETQAA